MKKTAVLCAGVILAASMASPAGVFAESAEYNPELYFKAQSAEGADAVSDGLVIISPDKIREGDITLNIGVYINDESMKVDAVSAKWRSESGYITLDNLLDPSVSTGTTKEYTTPGGETFTTDLTPNCYSTIRNGALKVPTPDMSVHPEINSMYFTYASVTSPYKWLGTASDDYALTSFDAVISSDIPEGVYEIVFATRDNTEGKTDSYSHGHIYYDIDNSRDFYPETSDLMIAVGDFGLGDVNLDGIVDARDASLILTEYAVTASGGVPSFDSLEKYVGNVNKDTVIDSRDASVVLTYYAYTATGGKESFEEFLKNNEK